MQEIARFHKLLSDEARLRILWLLFNRRELCVCDITAVLGITQSKASRHLAALRVAGLVRDRRAGTWMYYGLEKPVEPGPRAALAALKNQLARDPEAGALLARLEGCRGGAAGTLACAPGTAARRPATRKDRT
ncbi:MAG: metalloregulator ArsR/SmtB family transcription factor [bacterium]|nr:metalloregulator ArsR/SmtB family transcription factor [bacterium]